MLGAVAHPGFSGWSSLPSGDLHGAACRRLRRDVSRRSATCRRMDRRAGARTLQPPLGAIDSPSKLLPSLRWSLRRIRHTQLLQGSVDAHAFYSRSDTPESGADWRRFFTHDCAASRYILGSATSVSASLIREAGSRFATLPTAMRLRRRDVRRDGVGAPLAAAVQPVCGPLRERSGSVMDVGSARAGRIVP